MAGSLIWADVISVEVRANEVWLLRSGQPKQLTRDGRAKHQAVLSVDEDRIAYYEECPQAEGCMPSVVILDLDGKRLQTVQPRLAAVGSPEPCASILGTSWVGSDVIGVECHLNPSLSEYVEVNLTSGKIVRDLLGYGFTSSPDGGLVAHVGPVIHFAPPFAQSNYLMMDNTTVYPLPEGTGPVTRKPYEASPDVVQKQGAKHIGIHSFVPRFAWSPSSTRVAFIDCVFDWIESGAVDPGGSPIGDETGRHCSLATVSPSGTFALLPLRDVPLASIDQSRVGWVDDHRIRLEFLDRPTRILVIP